MQWKSILLLILVSAFVPLGGSHKSWLIYNKFILEYRLSYRWLAFGLILQNFILSNLYFRAKDCNSMIYFLILVKYRGTSDAL